jgi:6-phosphofructo-2-kinase
MAQQHSDIARSAIMTSASSPERQRNGVTSNGNNNHASPNKLGNGKDASLMPPKTIVGRALGNEVHSDSHKGSHVSKNGVGFALTDTPISTAPPSPQMYVFLSFLQ